MDNDVECTKETLVQSEQRPEDEGLCPITVVAIDEDDFQEDEFAEFSVLREETFEALVKSAAEGTMVDDVSDFSEISEFAKRKRLELAYKDVTEIISRYNPEVFCDNALLAVQRGHSKFFREYVQAPLMTPTNDTSVDALWSAMRQKCYQYLNTIKAFAELGEDEKHSLVHDEHVLKANLFTSLILSNENDVKLPSHLIIQFQMVEIGDNLFDKVLLEFYKSAIYMYNLDLTECQKMIVYVLCLLTCPNCEQYPDLMEFREALFKVLEFTIFPSVDADLVKPHVSAIFAFEKSAQRIMQLISASSRSSELLRILFFTPKYIGEFDHIQTLSTLLALI